MHEILTGTFASGASGPRLMEPHHQVQFSVKPKTEIGRKYKIFMQFFLIVYRHPLD